MFNKCKYERQVIRGYLSALESFSGTKGEREFFEK